MALSESDTRARLIDPAIHARGWTEDLIRREETTGAIEIIDGKPRKRSKGRVDYALRVKVNVDTQPVAVALIEEAPTLDVFRTRWVTPSDRQQKLGHMPDAGRSVMLVRNLEEMQDYDLYDVLAELGYGMAPRTRIERADAFTYKHTDWLIQLPPQAATAIKAIAAQFAKAGTDGLENPQVFQTPEVVRAGGLAALKSVGKPADVLRETKERMFAA